MSWVALKIRMMRAPSFPSKIVLLSSCRTKIREIMWVSLLGCHLLLMYCFLRQPLSPAKFWFTQSMIMVRFPLSPHIGRQAFTCSCGRRILEGSNVFESLLRHWHEINTASQKNIKIEKHYSKSIENKTLHSITLRQRASSMILRRECSTRYGLSRSSYPTKDGAPGSIPAKGWLKWYKNIRISHSW